MKKVFVVFVSVLMLLIISCEKDYRYVPHNRQCKLLKEINMHPFNDYDSIYPYYEYVYNEGRLVRRYVYVKYILTSFEPSSSGSTLVKRLLDSIIYDPKGRVYENYHHPDGSELNLVHQRFFYSGNKIERIKFISYDGTNAVNFQGQESFSYSKENKLISSAKTTTSSYGSIKKEIKYYKYANQNLTRIDETISYSADTSYNYTDVYYLRDDSTYISYEIFGNYDGMRNPYKNFFMLDDLRNKSLSENNFSYHFIDYSDKFSKYQSDNTYTFSEYNEYNYPARVGYTELMYDCE